MDTDTEHAADQLVEWMQRNDYSQRRLGEVLGVTQAAVSEWKRKRSTPDEKYRLAIEQLTGISASAWLPADEIASRAELEKRVCAALEAPAPTGTEG